MKPKNNDFSSEFVGVISSDNDIVNLKYDKVEGKNNMNILSNPDLKNELDSLNRKHINKFNLEK